MANWIAGAIKRPGALHRALHVPEGEKIPAKKMAKARSSDNPRMRRMAALAHTLKGFHHADGGAVHQGEGRAPKSGSHKKRRG
jgi:hypothetical protein